MSPARKLPNSVGRRPDIESDLDEKYNVQWSYLEQVPASGFDIEGSLQNQARFEAVHEDTVEQYREAVERGDPFPAVIAYRRRKNGRLIIIDGNHRLVAHEKAGRPLDVYEVAQGTRGPTIALMTYSFNTRHGRPTTETERVSQALYLFDSGADQEKAAEAVNIPIRLLRRALTARKASERAKEQNIDDREWGSLAHAARGRLTTIKTDEGFKDATHLAFNAGLTSPEVDELVNLLNTSGRSARKHREIVKAQRGMFSDRIQDNGSGTLRGKGRRPVGPRGRIGMALGQVLALPDDLSAITRAYAEGERSSTASSLLDASERLRKIALALDSSLA